jgi:hypothetical protein
MLSTDTYLLIACPFWSYLYFPLYQTPWGSDPALPGSVPNTGYHVKVEIYILTI